MRPSVEHRSWQVGMRCKIAWAIYGILVIQKLCFRWYYLLMQWIKRRIMGFINITLRLYVGRNERWEIGVCDKSYLRQKTLLLSIYRILFIPQTINRLSLMDPSVITSNRYWSVYATLYSLWAKIDIFVSPDLQLISPFATDTIT